MVGAISVHVLVAHSIAGTEDECRADLSDSRARLVHVVSALRSRSRGFPRPWVQKLEPTGRPHGRGVRRCRIVVHQHEKRNLLFADKRIGVTSITGSDRDHVGAEAGDLVVALAQLRGMLAAVQSTEVPEEHHHDRLVAPEITESVPRSFTIGERRRRQCLQIHSGDATRTSRRGGSVRSYGASAPAAGAPYLP